MEICEPAEEVVTEAAEADCRVLGCGPRGAECGYQPAADRFTCQCSHGYKVCRNNTIVKMYLALSASSRSDHLYLSVGHCFSPKMFQASNLLLSC